MRRSAFKWCFLLFILSGCSPGPEEHGDRLIRRLGSEPDTLNPITATDYYEETVNRYVTETMLWRNYETLEIEPQIPCTWTESDDHLVYTFEFQPGILWHDGVELTADDVVYSFRMIMDPKVDCAHLRNYFKDIETVQKTGKYSFRVVWKKPYFRSLEMSGGIPLVPKHVFDDGADFNKNPAGRHPIGTGPYKFVSWTTGRKIVIERNERFYGKKPFWKRVVFKIIKDDPIALQIFKKEQLDMIGLRPFQWERQTESRAFQRKFNKVDFYLPAYSYLGWNLRREPFSDRRVRLAMTHMVDRKPILDKIFYGLGTIVTGPFYVKGPEYDRNIKPYPYDPKRAEELLAEAGWRDTDEDGWLDKEGNKFSFELLMPSGVIEYEQMATVLKEDLKTIGVDMGIRRIEWATFLRFVHEHKFDAYAAAWILAYVSDPYQLWHSSQAEKGSNYVGFVNGEADILIDKIRREFDGEKRRKMCYRFHEIIHDAQPYTFMFTSKSLMAYTKAIEGFRTYVIRPGYDIRQWRRAP